VGQRELRTKNSPRGIPFVYVDKCWNSKGKEKIQIMRGGKNHKEAEKTQTRRGVWGARGKKIKT